MSEISKDIPLYQRFSWILHVTANGLLATSGAYLLTTPDEIIIGIIATGFAVLGLLLSFGAFRQGKDYAWGVMWVYPATLGTLALFFLINGGIGLGGYYLGLALLGALAQVLSFPTFR